MQKRDNPHKPGALISMKRDRLRRRRWPDKKAVSQDGEQSTGKRLNEDRIVNPLFIKLIYLNMASGAAVCSVRKWEQEAEEEEEEEATGNEKRETESRKAKGGPRQDKKTLPKQGL
ncbi:hypothetical protein [Raoultella sp. HC6]|uniref:hypothetical protein n=1 Tax=Raoultella sp. HC6 TaxID=2923366 RepID=UPI001F510E7C|nr:hypothetical protein [Raoultella sp. HC6]